MSTSAPAACPTSSLFRLPLQTPVPPVVAAPIIRPAMAAGTGSESRHLHSIYEYGWPGNLLYLKSQSFLDDDCSYRAADSDLAQTRRRRYQEIIEVTCMPGKPGAVPGQPTLSFIRFTQSCRTISLIRMSIEMSSTYNKYSALPVDRDVRVTAAAAAAATVQSLPIMRTPKPKRTTGERGNRSGKPKARPEQEEGSERSREGGDRVGGCGNGLVTLISSEKPPSLASSGAPGSEVEGVVTKGDEGREGAFGCPDRIGARSILKAFLLGFDWGFLMVAG
ncbi:hypothetical protein OPV22_002873 [Ensete ventricosum]|uniref:Uncharacterized protein n=1 Tax=Ensete ventricosum TaxID=4639 RepID=A0AAV8RZB9_ENSVE|nr:hypothetical protein OPV22_002873 [Ensete ventricosum]